MMSNLPGCKAQLHILVPIAFLVMICMLASYLCSMPPSAGTLICNPGNAGCAHSRPIVRYLDTIHDSEGFIASDPSLGIYVPRRTSALDVDPKLEYFTPELTGPNTYVIDSKITSPAKLRIYYNIPLPKVINTQKPDGIAITEENMKQLMKAAEISFKAIQDTFPLLNGNSATWTPMVMADNGLMTRSHPKGTGAGDAISGPHIVLCKPFIALEVATGVLGSLYTLTHEFGHVFAAKYIPQDISFGNGVTEGICDAIASTLIVDSTDCVDEVRDMYTSKDNSGNYKFLKNPYSASGMTYNTGKPYNGTLWMHIIHRYSINTFQKFIVDRDANLFIARKNGWTVWEAVAKYFDKSQNVNSFCAQWLSDILTFAWFRTNERLEKSKKTFIDRKHADESFVWYQRYSVEDALNFTKSKESNTSISWTSKHRLESFGFSVIDFGKLIKANSELLQGKTNQKLRIEVSSVGSTDKLKESSAWVIVLIQSLPNINVTPTTSNVQIFKEYESNSMIVDISNIDHTYVLGVMHTKPSTGLGDKTLLYNIRVSVPLQAQLQAKVPVPIPIQAQAQVPTKTQVQGITLSDAGLYKISDGRPPGLNSSPLKSTPVVPPQVQGITLSDAGTFKVTDGKPVINSSTLKSNPVFPPQVQGITLSDAGTYKITEGKPVINSSTLKSNPVVTITKSKKP